MLLQQVEFILLEKERFGTPCSGSAVGNTRVFLVMHSKTLKLEIFHEFSC
jgi:hypothetical protein